MGLTYKKAKLCGFIHIFMSNSHESSQKNTIKVLETGLKSPQMCIDSALAPSQPLKCTDLPSRGLRIVKTYFHSGSSYFRKIVSGEPVLGEFKLTCITVAIP